MSLWICLVAGLSKLVITLLALWGLYLFLAPDRKDKENPEEGPVQKEA